jgi:hypothetical protein
MYDYTTSSAGTPRWLSGAELRAMGFEAGGPEIDYGMGWGERGDVRVSFAPLHGLEDGYLYAHDPADDRYLILAARTTRDQVDVAWRDLTACTSAPDAYVALASLDHGDRPMQVGPARSLLRHCVDREMAAYRDYVAVGGAGDERFMSAQALVVQRSARTAAEQLLHHAAGDEGHDVEPVVVRYRILGQPGWTGRVAGRDLDSACAMTRSGHEVAARHDLDLQATSVTHGLTTVAAPRLPELDFAAARSLVAVNAPQIGI